jgi:DNA helicase IV
MFDEKAAPADNSARVKARARAASLLKLPETEIEDDLIDFIVVDGGDVLLHARAGSGKTTALGIKVSYLTNDLGVDPSTIMMLTFNNAAARSLEKKLSEFNVPEGVRVRTFHALGQRIVRAHFGNARRPVFDKDSDDYQRVEDLKEEAISDAVSDPFFLHCAKAMRTHYGKRKDYVQSIGNDALRSAFEFLRVRGYGLQNPFPNAWDVHGPIGGTAMKAVIKFEKQLRENRLLDGAAVLQAASWTIERELEQGVPKPSEAHGVNWVFIDEYQDFSAPYMRLVDAIRRLNGGLNIQCVGDDWQAINGFAGADLSYFTDPGQFLENPQILPLLRNRRSGSRIVSWGNSVMKDAGIEGAPAEPFRGNATGQMKSFKVKANTDIRYIAERLANIIELEMADVALIARRWKVGDHKLLRITDLVKLELRNKGYKGKVVGISAHGSKGLEYDQVLLLDDGAFESEHPTKPILDPLIDDQEYRRELACLKHVAGTRAKLRLDVVDMT